MDNLFCVFASARSGSNYFSSLLNLHSKIWMHGELFHQNNMYPTLQKPVRGDGPIQLPPLGLNIEDRNENPIDFLNSVVKHTNHSFVTGFKLFPNHNEEVFQYVLGESKIKKIVLIRLNALAQFSSDLEASARNKYAFVEGEEIDKVNIEFDPEGFRKRRDYISDWYARVIERLNSTEQNYLLMPYEFMANEVFLRSVFPFLGLPQPDRETLNSQFSKSGNRNVVARFEKPEKVREHLVKLGEEHLEFDVRYSFAERLKRGKKKAGGK